MILNYPLADATTSSNTRHRWAYYDGVNSVQYRVPIGVQFGAFPYHFEVIAGPSGLMIGQDYGDANYGVVTWTPSGSYTNEPVTIRVYDQDGGAPLDISWTVSTSSATTRFLFVSPTGSDAASGAIGSPKQTLANVFGSTASSTTNAGAIVYLRTGTYAIPSYTDSVFGSGDPYFQVSASKPMSLLGFPGETATLNATVRTAFTTNDMFLENLTYDGFRGSGDMRVFNVWVQRFTAFDIRWINAGTVDSLDNACMFFFSDQGTPIPYSYVRDCHVTGWSNTGSNSYGLTSVYARQYALFDNCSFVGASADGLYLKGQVQDVTVRECYVNLSNSGDHVMSNGFQSPHARIEICYCRIKALDGASKHLFDSGTVEDFWFYRNTLYRVTIENTWGTVTSGTVENCAIVSNITPRVEVPPFANSGTECQGNLAAGIIDSTTLALTGTYRTNYLGQRGHEISA